MKKRMAALVILLLLSMPLSASAFHDPGTGIQDTSHDLSVEGVGSKYPGAGTADELNRICIYCHAPHHAITANVDAAVFSRLNYYPLWNHPISNIASYSTYTSGFQVPNYLQHQLNAVVTLSQPGSSSILCLSCHDGSMAINVYGYNRWGEWSTRAVSYAQGSILIGGGGDLRNHHPIGFDYDAVAALDDEIYPSNTALLGGNPYGLLISDILVNGRMECVTCHDVHNTKNSGPKFTYVLDYRSDFCLSCHRK